MCAPLRLPVLTNAVDFGTGELVVPARGPLLSVLDVRRVQAGADQGRARHRGRDTVLVGDGISDRKAALLADVVFAKGSLALVVRGRRRARTCRSPRSPTCGTR